MTEIAALLSKFGLPHDTLANLATPVFDKTLYAGDDVSGAGEATLQHLRTEFLARTNRVSEIDPAWIAEAAEQARANLDCNTRRLIRIVCDAAMLRSQTPTSKADADIAMELLAARSDSVAELRRDLLVREVVKQAVLHVRQWRLEALFDVDKLAGIESWQALECAAP